MNRTCATCQAFRKLLSQESDHTEGECRRHAPRAVGNQAYAQAYALPAWPITYCQDWCLEWVGPDPMPRAGGKREFPDDFTPTDQHYALAEQLGVNLGEQLGLMASWAKSNGEKKKDWNQTLSNWLRNAKLKQRLHFR